MQDHDDERVATGPGASFREPEEIMGDATLSPERKRELLGRWRRDLDQDVRRTLGLVERVGRALAFLDTETGRRTQGHERVLHGPGMAPTPSAMDEEAAASEDAP